MLGKGLCTSSPRILCTRVLVSTRARFALTDGAPDPRKSLQYVRGSHGQFMFICRFSLKRGTLHAGPATSHRNSHFDEFCIFDERNVVVLWMLKLK